MSDPSILLRAARARAGLSQGDLARRLDVTQAAVAKLERPSANPTVGTLDRAVWATGHRLVLDAEPRRPGVDESLIRRQLELSPAARIRGIEQLFAQAKRLSDAGARGRGEQT